MLVLTRQEGEKIYIGNDIIIEVTRYGGDRVRLGISAPPDKTVLRGELRHGSQKEETNEKTIRVIDIPTDSAFPVARCG